MGGLSPDDVAVRRMEPGDGDVLLDWAHREGWAYDARDVDRFLELGGGYVAEAGGEAVGVLTASTYGPVAWIGNVIVPPEHRNQGVGGATLEAALGDLATRGVETARLYAVDGAVSLYQRAGFVEEGRAWSLVGEGLPGSPDLPRAEPRDLDDLVAFDEAAFGASRRPLLASLLEAEADEGVLLRDEGGDGAVRGYAFVKGGDEVAELGPAVTPPGDDGEAAARLAEAALRIAGDQVVEAGVRSENPLAREVLEERGFEEAFPATTMRWGADAHGGEPERWLAVGGMAKG